MPKKFLVGLLAVSTALGLMGYWWYAQPQPDRLAIVALPPVQVLSFVAVPGLPQTWADLRQSQFFQQISSPAFWQRAVGAEGYRRLMAEKQRLEQYLGLPLTEATITFLLGREFGVALVPSHDKIVDVIVYVRVSGTEKIAATMNRTFSRTIQDAVRLTQTVDGVEIVMLHLQDAPTSVSYAFLGTLAVLSTDQTWVIDAIKAHQGTAPDRLYTTPAFKALHLEATESLLAYGYSDVERLQAATPAELSWASQVASATTLPMLQPTGKITLKATCVGSGLMVDTMAWYAPHGATSVLREVERDGAIPPWRGVPAETLYLTHIDLLNLQGLRQLLRPPAAMGDQGDFQEMLAQFRDWVGVDLERDVLPLLTGVVGLGVTAPLGAQRGGLAALPGVFLTLGLTDESGGGHLIQTIGAHVGGPLFSAFLQRQLHDGQAIYYVDNPLLFVNPGYVISHQQLILGSDVSLLQQMLDAAAGKTAALTNTNAYRDVRRHFRITGGSFMFVDVSTAVEQARALRLPLGVLMRALQRSDQEAAAGEVMSGDPWALVELLRPLRYIGVASQAEAEGIRTEVHVTFQDMP